MSSILKFQFSLENTLGKLLEKLEGWLDAIILKLPNLVLALVVMIAFWFIAKFISRLSKKFLLGKSAQQTIKDITAKIILPWYS